MSHNQRGFTLIELLVVIAIISIIAAIIFPVFSTVREKGRQISCISNMRQLGMAFQQYEQDADDQMPGAYDGPLGAAKEGGWMYYAVFLTFTPQKSFDPSRGSIYPYVNNKQVYLCPSDGPGQTDGDSYAINSCVAGAPDPVTSLRPGKMLSQFDNPSNIMLLTEENAAPLGSTNDAFLNLTFAGGGFDTLSNRHLGSLDVAFVDGHVKSYQISRVHVLGLQTGVPNEVPGVTNCP